MHPKPIRTLRSTAAPCALALAASLPLPALAQGDGEDAARLDTIVVTGTRTETPLSEIARSVTVVSRDQVEEQAKVSRNLGEILANTVPGLGPSTEAATNYGQSLRGRNFLVLIDGIPQSTPLRDGFRDLNTIAPSAIERIEVVRGGTAVYGFGATGGVINIITREASEKPVEVYSQAGTSFSTEHFDDSIDYETEHRVSGTQGSWDYVLSGSFIERGGRFDADGNRIPPDPFANQGGFADSTQYDVLGKAGYDFDGGRQRIEIMLNDFSVEQDTDYTFSTSLVDGRTAAVPLSEAAAGTASIIDPGTDNTTGRISYNNADLGGSQVNAKLYYGDQSVVFPKYPGFDQSEILSEKYGVRSTIETPVEAIASGATLTWGGDYLRDETRTEAYGSGGESTTPTMEQDALAGFAELEVPLGRNAILRGGVRQEQISVDTETVVNRVGNTIDGGTLDYSETLFNAGAVFFVSDSVDLFTSYSQGFSLSDLGRVLTDGGPSGGGATINAEEFESEAQKVDNYEVGLRFYGDRLSASAAAFYSEATNGTTFTDDLRIQKFEEEIWGVEGTADYRVTEALSVGGTFTWAQGQRLDENGNETWLDGTRISPVKLTAFAEHQTRAWWSNRLQVLYVGDRDKFPDASGPSDFLDFGKGEVNGYTLVDAVSRFEVGPGTLTVAVKNLLNEDYFPAINQAYNRPVTYSKGSGRRIGIGYELIW